MTFRLFCLLIISSTIAFSQKWERVNPLHPNANFQKVKFINDKLAFGLGFNGIIAKTTDAGKNWKFIDAKSTYAVGALTDIAFINQNIGFILSQVGTLKTIDGGNTWKKIEMPRISAMRAISFADDKVGIIVGRYGIIFRTTNGGNTWTTLIGKKDQTYINGGFFTNKNGIILGTEVLVTDNAGQSWTKKTVFDEANEIPEFISIINTTDCVIGVRDKNTSMVEFYLSTDMGKSWNKSEKSIDEKIKECKFFSKTECICVGGTMYNYVFHTKDFGQTWTRKYLEPEFYDLSLDFPKNSKSGLIGAGGKISIVEEENDELKITRSLPKNIAPDLSSMIDFNCIDNFCLLLGDLYHEGVEPRVTKDPKKELYISADYGKSWKKTNFPVELKTTDYHPIHVEGKYFFITNYTDQSIYRLNTATLSWEKIKQSSTRYLRDRTTANFDVSGQNIVAVDSNGYRIKLSTNAGKEWKVLNYTIEKDEYIGGIGITADNFIYTSIGNREQLDKVKLKVSRNLGETWEELTDIPQNPTQVVYFNDATHGYMKNVFDVTLETNDSGKSWKKWALSDCSYTRIRFTNAIGFSIPCDAGAPLYTKDSGKTWQELKNIPYPFRPTKLVSSGGKIYAFNKMELYISEWPK